MRTGLWVVGVLTIICVVALISVVGGSRLFRRTTDRFVMTRNFYLGGSINRPLRVALDRSGHEGVLAPAEVSTDGGTRSKLLTEKAIAAQRADPRRGGAESVLVQDLLHR